MPLVVDLKRRKASVRRSVVVRELEGWHELIPVVLIAVDKPAAEVDAHAHSGLTCTVSLRMVRGTLVVLKVSQPGKGIPKPVVGADVAVGDDRRWHSVELEDIPEDDFGKSNRVEA